MCSPQYQNLSDSVLPMMFKKSIDFFEVIEEKLRKLINKTCQPSDVNQLYFKTTEVSREVIKHGFAPFDITNDTQLSMTKSEKRKNLKALLKWLCEHVTTPEKPLPDDFDLLNGKEPSYYGLSSKESKWFLFQFCKVSFKSFANQLYANYRIYWRMETRALDDLTGMS